MNHNQVNFKFYESSKMKQVLFSTTLPSAKLLALALTLMISSQTTHAELKQDWPWWRGPSSNGVAAPGQKPVTTWSNKENIIWKTSVPGRGHSSPIVVDNNVILTTAEKSSGTQSVICFNRKTGKQLWITQINQGGFPKSIHKKNTHTSPTVACNGQTLFATFNNHDSVQLAALTLEGKVIWKKSAGTFKPVKYQFGYAPSPLLYKSSVIVSSEFGDQGFIAAFDQKTGEEQWRTPRIKISSYSTPIIARVSGKVQLFITGGVRVSSYNPDTGKLLWATPAVAHATCGTMAWHNDLVFASGGYPEKETVAVKADGSGTVVWRNKQKRYEQSMLVHDGYLYAFADTGVAYCWNANNGKEQWRQRLTGPVSASPTLVNNNIYTADERGNFYIFKANPSKFELVAKNKLGSESFATPIICNNQIFLRVADTSTGTRKETLYCIGK